MSELPHCGVLAVDVGSSCVKLGWFPPSAACAEAHASALPIAAPRLAIPDEVLRVAHQGRRGDQWLAEVDAWLAAIAPPEQSACAIGSVHSGAAELLNQYLWRHTWRRFEQITLKDLPLVVRTAEPDRVGIDRLLGAMAVNRLRTPAAPAISVDMGTAITVDLIAADGGFEGGAILAGPALELAALHRGTASLPELDLSALAAAPSAIGKTTGEALAAGAFWGAVGAVNELIRQHADNCVAEPEIYLTGGGVAAFVGRLGVAKPQAAAGQVSDLQAKHVPHMVLAGIRVVVDGWLVT